MDTEDGHNADLTRREVLSTAGAAGIVAGADALVGHGHAQAGKPPHVVIVGAGLAGLCAAHELQKRRWTYTILEADKLHVGGRVRTVRFSNGTYGELGAMRIPENHKTTLRYVDEFRLPRREFVMDNPATYYHARNHRPEPRSALDKFRRLYRLEPGEMNKTPDDLWGDAVAGLLKTLSREERSDLDTSNSFTTSKITELDRLSLRRAMEMGGLSEEAIELLCVTYGVGTLQHSALTEHLREESNDVWTRPFYEIEGGTERLPDEFKKRLYSKPNMGHEVIALEQDENGATAVYRSARQRNRVTGDFLLCTIPLPVLARLETPSFSGEKRRAIRDVFYEFGHEGPGTDQYSRLGNRRQDIRRQQLYRPDDQLDLLSIRQFEKEGRFDDQRAGGNRRREVKGPRRAGGLLRLGSGGSPTGKYDRIAARGTCDQDGRQGARFPRAARRHSPR